MTVISRLRLSNSDDKAGRTTDDGQTDVNNQRTSGPPLYGTKFVFKGPLTNIVNVN